MPMTQEIKEATVQKWLVKEGDVVEQFQDLAEVSTDKLFTQINATEDGRIHKIYVNAGEACQVGDLLLELDVDGETAAHEVKKDQNDKDTTNTKPLPETEITTKTATQICSSSQKITSTPFVRDYAKQKGVDINQIRVRS